MVSHTMIFPPTAALSVLTAMADAQFTCYLDNIFGFSGFSDISDNDSGCGLDNANSDSASVETVTPLRLAGTRLALATSGSTGKLIPPTPIMILFRPARPNYTPQTLSEIWAESDLWIMTGIKYRYWDVECVPFPLKRECFAKPPMKKLGAPLSHKAPVQ
jgi:hypothetical protein